MWFFFIELGLLACTNLAVAFLTWQMTPDPKTLFFVLAGLAGLTMTAGMTIRLFGYITQMMFAMLLCSLNQLTFLFILQVSGVGDSAGSWQFFGFFLAILQGLASFFIHNRYMDRV